MTAVDASMHQLAVATEEDGTEGPTIIEMTTVHQLAAATEEDGQKGYLSGFDFANRRVIHLRNEWTHYLAVCRGTPP